MTSEIPSIFYCTPWNLLMPSSGVLWIWIQKRIICWIYTNTKSFVCIFLGGDAEGLDKTITENIDKQTDNNNEPSDNDLKPQLEDELKVKSEDDLEPNKKKAEDGSQQLSDTSQKLNDKDTTCEDQLSPRISQDHDYGLPSTVPQQKKDDES